MGRHLSKAQLYRAVDRLREQLVGAACEYPISLPDCCNRPGSRVVMQLLPLRTEGLRGMALPSPDEEGPDIIFLNSNRSRTEQNFDCGHELIHLSLHRGAQLESFNCFEKVRAQQNRFLEWQANEGAAELLAPYRELLPLVRAAWPGLHRWQAIAALRTQLAERFGVSEVVIRFRFESLKYEIFQYISGVPLEQVQLLSDQSQRMQGISVASLGQREAWLRLREESPRFRVPDGAFLGQRYEEFLGTHDRWLYDV